MAEETNGDASAPEEGVPPIVINAQYTKDLSFEAPTAPGIFSVMQQNQPDVQISVNVNAQEFEPGLYEVVLDLSARCSVGDDVAFILELEYAGLFTLNVDDEVKSAVLLIECPRLIFPFARNILADVSRDGGFPPVMLGPIDFAALYQQEAEKQAAAEAEA
ncbi:MAG: protein-export chaperone SecB [Rhodospirillaceae bacterium]|jgi:preprotein translocase subunit SecB|nr:protein-export chaperone SecB [Rhodospirillaceae bacterium]